MTNQYKCITALQALAVRQRRVPGTCLPIRRHTGGCCISELNRNSDPVQFFWKLPINIQGLCWQACIRFIPPGQSSYLFSHRECPKVPRRFSGGWPGNRTELWFHCLSDFTAFLGGLGRGHRKDGEGITGLSWERNPCFLSSVKSPLRSSKEMGFRSDYNHTASLCTYSLVLMLLSNWFTLQARKFVSTDSSLKFSLSIWKWNG